MKNRISAKFYKMIRFRTSLFHVSPLFLGEERSFHKELARDLFSLKPWQLLLNAFSKPCYTSKLKATFDGSVNHCLLLGRI